MYSAGYMKGAGGGLDIGRRRPYDLIAATVWDLHTAVDRVKARDLLNWCNNPKEEGRWMYWKPS